MDTVAKVLWIGCGGFIGANLRYWLGNVLQRKGDGSFPWETLIINVSGSIVIGLFMGLFAGLNWSTNSRLFVAIGILGGYTTYSSFAFEALTMLGQRQYGLALLYIEGTAMLSVAGAWLGLVMSRLVLGGRI